MIRSPGISPQTVNNHDNLIHHNLYESWKYHARDESTGPLESLLNKLTQSKGEDYDSEWQVGQYVLAQCPGDSSLKVIKKL